MTPAALELLLELADAYHDKLLADEYYQDAKHIRALMDKVKLTEATQ